MTPVNLYYTNNIVLPQYGARLTGKLGPWALGVLGVDDRSPGQDVPPGDPEYGTRAQFYVGRVNRDIGSLSDVGIIYADREYQGSYNRAGGIGLSLAIEKSLDTDWPSHLIRNSKSQQRHAGRTAVRKS